MWLHVITWWHLLADLIRQQAQRQAKFRQCSAARSVVWTAWLFRTHLVASLCGGMKLTVDLRSQQASQHQIAAGPHSTVAWPKTARTGRFLT